MESMVRVVTVETRDILISEKNTQGLRCWVQWFGKSFCHPLMPSDSTLSSSKLNLGWAHQWLQIQLKWFSMELKGNHFQPSQQWQIGQQCCHFDCERAANQVSPSDLHISQIKAAQKKELIESWYFKWDVRRGWLMNKHYRPRLQYIYWPLTCIR